MPWVAITTPDGSFQAEFTQAGLAALRFPGAAAESPASSHEKTLPATWLRQTAAAIRAVLLGKPAGPLPPLDLRDSTPFQRQVWQALQAIPPGATRSYGEIAADIGRPRSARAVGQACGANPIPLLIPCHRVLAHGHRLGGFSGGLPWKERLLQREGVSWTGRA